MRFREHDSNSLISLIHKNQIQYHPHLLQHPDERINYIYYLKTRSLYKSDICILVYGHANQNSSLICFQRPYRVLKCSSSKVFFPHRK